MQTARRLSDAEVCRALNKAAQDAVEIHRQAGVPLVVWRDGKVALVPAEQVAVKRNASRSRRPKSGR